MLADILINATYLAIFFDANNKLNRPRAFLIVKGAFKIEILILKVIISLAVPFPFLMSWRCATTPYCMVLSRKELTEQLR